MLSVLRQEWAGRKNTIFVWSIISLVAGILCLLISFISPSFSQKMDFIVPLWITVVTTLYFFGLPLYTLTKGAGSIEYWTKDMGYLDLLVPVSPYKLILGKMLMGLAEFLIYLIPCCFYISFIVPGLLINDPDITESYFELVKLIYSQVLGEYFWSTFNIVIAAIVFFLVLEAICSCAIVVYLSFIKSKKGSSLIIAILVYLAIYLMIKTVSFTLSLTDFSLTTYASWKSFWVTTIGCSLFGGLYYFITCFLIQHKVEV
jgi:hypothetical protein